MPEITLKMWIPGRDDVEYAKMESSLDVGSAFGHDLSPPPRRPLCPTGGLQMFLCGSRRRRRPAEPHLKRKRSWTLAWWARGAPAARKGHHSASPGGQLRRRALRCVVHWGEEADVTNGVRADGSCLGEEAVKYILNGFFLLERRWQNKEWWKEQVNECTKCSFETCNQPP